MDTVTLNSIGLRPRMVFKRPSFWRIVAIMFERPEVPRHVVSHRDPLAQFQAANMAVLMAICRAMIDSKAVDPAILISHLEDLSVAAMASELSPGAQAVVIEQILKEVKEYAARQGIGSAGPN